MPSTDYNKYGIALFQYICCEYFVDCDKHHYDYCSKL